MTDGMPIGQAAQATIRVADFITRGIAAQKAVDEIIAAEQGKPARTMRTGA
jgi:hypothetical protein